MKRRRPGWFGRGDRLASGLAVSALALLAGFICGRAEERAGQD